MSGTAPRLVADRDIPGVGEIFGRDYRLHLLPPGEITRANLQRLRADALLVRTLTPVGEELLDGTSVRFVGTASSGTEHLDQNFLAAAGLTVADGAGGNARAVVEHVLAVLAAFVQRQGRELQQHSLGILGCGQVGGALKPLVEALGLKVLVRDPWQPGCADTPLREVLNCDLLSLHCALTEDGPEPTRHLIGPAAVPRCQLLINTARGEVLAPGFAAAAPPGLRLALDVWHGEPRVQPAEVRLCWHSSAHRAGHSLEGKLGCVLKVARRAGQFWQLPPPPEPTLPPPPPLELPPGPGAEAEIERHGLPVSLLQAILDLPGLHRQMQSEVGAAETDEQAARAFVRLRSAAPVRRQFAARPLSDKGLSPAAARVLEVLGFELRRAGPGLCVKSPGPRKLAELQ